MKKQKNKKKCAMCGKMKPFTENNFIQKTIQKDKETKQDVFICEPCTDVLG